MNLSAIILNIFEIFILELLPFVVLPLFFSISSLCSVIELESTEREPLIGLSCGVQVLIKHKFNERYFTNNVISQSAEIATSVN